MSAAPLFVVSLSAGAFWSPLGVVACANATVETRTPAKARASAFFQLFMRCPPLEHGNRSASVHHRTCRRGRARGSAGLAAFDRRAPDVVVHRRGLDAG